MGIMDFISRFLPGKATLSSLTDDELKTLREITRRKYNSAGSLGEAGKLYELLHKIDSLLSKRAWGGEKPSAPALHREHGWHLPNDD